MSIDISTVRDIFMNYINSYVDEFASILSEKKEVLTKDEIIAIWNNIVNEKKKTNEKKTKKTEVKKTKKRYDSDSESDDEKEKKKSKKKIVKKPVDSDSESDEEKEKKKSKKKVAKKPVDSDSESDEPKKAKTKKEKKPKKTEEKKEELNGTEVSQEEIKKINESVLNDDTLECEKKKLEQKAKKEKKLKDKDSDSDEKPKKTKSKKEKKPKKTEVSDDEKEKKTQDEKPKNDDEKPPIKALKINEGLLKSFHKITIDDMTFVTNKMSKVVGVYKNDNEYGPLTQKHIECINKNTELDISCDAKKIEEKEVIDSELDKLYDEMDKE
jgi:hypothetical protein